MVTAGVLGSMAATAVPTEAAVEHQQDDRQMSAAISSLGGKLDTMNDTLAYGLKGPGCASGFMADIRGKLSTHIRAAGKFPEFMEVGLDVFYDIYDWHVRYSQPIQITRISEQRFAIQWMFTQFIVRWEQDPKYLGVPFDRA